MHGGTSLVQSVEQVTLSPRVLNSNKAQVGQGAYLKKMFFKINETVHNVLSIIFGRW